MLGISPLDKDSTVSIFSDGKVLFAAGEERFTRVKLQDGFSYKSLEAALKYLAISSCDIDLVAYPFFEWPHEARLISKNIEDEAAFIRASRMDSWSKGVKQSLGRVPMGRMEVPGLQGPHERNRKSVLHESFYRLVGAGNLFSRSMALHASKSWREAAIKCHQHRQNQLEEGLNSLGLLSKLKRYDHHTAHAAARACSCTIGNSSTGELSRGSEV